MSELDIVDTGLSNDGTADAVRRLFADDGTVYLVTGFFTAPAYHELREDVREFLNRSPDNELVIVVGGGADQFSAAIARDLWDLDVDGDLRICKYPHGSSTRNCTRAGGRRRRW